LPQGIEIAAHCDHIQNMTDVLAACRSEIDSIDNQIIDLLVKRYGVVDQVVALKRAYGLPALIPSRVEEVVNHVKTRALQKGLSPALAENLWREIIAETIAYEQRKNVA
jgi:isochorismate pyruvate lyase